MPPPYIQTIHEEILYEYAKLISRSAYGTLLVARHVTGRARVIGNTFTQYSRIDRYE